MILFALIGSFRGVPLDAFSSLHSSTGFELGIRSSSKLSYKEFRHFERVTPLATSSSREVLEYLWSFLDPIVNFGLIAVIVEEIAVVFKQKRKSF